MPHSHQLMGWFIPFSLRFFYPLYLSQFNFLHIFPSVQNTINYPSGPDDTLVTYIYNYVITFERPRCSTCQKFLFRVKLFSKNTCTYWYVCNLIIWKHSSLQLNSRRKRAQSAINITCLLNNNIFHIKISKFKRLKKRIL